MSTLTADPQFSRGQTLGGGRTLTTEQGNNVIGFRKQFLDAHPRTGVVNSNRTVRCIALRNSTGAALLAGETVKFRVGDALGYAVATDYQTAVVDEYVPFTGVAANDVFWAVLDGPTTLSTAATLATVGTKVAVNTTANGKVIAGTGLGETIEASYANPNPSATGNLVRAIVGGSSNSASIAAAA